MKPERPEIPAMVGEEDILETLRYEKELVGMYLSSHPLDRFQFELDNFTTCQVSELENLIAECEQKKVKQKANIAGFVTNCQQMTTKTGRPWSKTTIEDKGGSYELALFGKDHEAFMSYMQLHNAIFLEGVIEEKYFVKPDPTKKEQPKESPYAFKVKNIMLLGNVSDSYIKGLSLKITTSQLTPEFREKLVGLIKENKGNVPLTISLFDPIKKWNIDFLSRKFKVGVTAQLINDIEKLRISYSVLKN
jgi:DNA polymerase-3 subunit alpha